jgi:hypothetical protein
VFALGTFAVLHSLPAGISWPKASVFALVAMLSSVLALVAYRYADEVLLQMHKTAWFWGSLMSIVTLIPVLIFVGWNLVPLPMLSPRGHVGQTQIIFVEGVAFALLTQGAAFLAMLGYQRLSRR